MNKLTVLAASMGAALLVAACGGGGGGGGSPVTSTYDIGAASTSTASALGATEIAVGTTDTTALAGATDAMDMTAAVGDTWRLVVNATDKTFVLIPVQSSYGLTNNSAQGTYTKTVNGAIETYTGTFGTPGQANSGQISIKFDTRTKSLIGTVSWNNGTQDLTSSVTGTKLVMGASIASLAGTYVFANQAQNQEDGQFKASTAGTLNIASNGLIKLCPGAKYDPSSGKCLKLDGTTPTDGSEIPVEAQLNASAGNNLSITPVPNSSKTLTLPNGIPNVKAHVQAGDLGPILVIDQDWINESLVRRTGIFVASRISSIDANKFAGDYFCPTIQVNNTTGGTLRVTATSFSLVGGSQSATVALNKVYDRGAGVERDFGGVMHITGTDNNNQPLHQFGFQLSSSWFAFQNGGADRLNFCQRI